MNIVRTATRLQDQDDLSTAFATTGQVPVWNNSTKKFNPTAITVNGASDVSATPTTTGQVLSWNSATSKYDPTTAATSVGIGSTLTGSPTTGAVLIVGTSGVLAQDTKLAFDATNKRLGVGVAVPTAALHAVSSAVTDVTLKAIGMASQTADLFQAKTSGGAGPTVTSAGLLTAPGAGSQSEVLGATATAVGTQGAAFGYGATATASFATAVGAGARVDVASGSGIAVGAGSWARQSGSIAVGGSNNNGVSAITIGGNTDGAYSIIMGRYALCSGAFPNYFAVGAASTATDPLAFIKTMSLGTITDAAPRASAMYTTTSGVGTDIGASDVALAGGSSTGLGTGTNPRGGAVRLQTFPRALTTGTAFQAAADRIVIAPERTVTTAVAADLLSLPLAAGKSASLRIDWSVEVWDGTDLQRLTGATTVDLANKAGTLSQLVTPIGTPSQVLTSGTLTVVFTASLASSVAKIQVTATTSLTPATGYPQVWADIKNHSRSAITLL